MRIAIKYLFCQLDYGIVIRKRNYLKKTNLIYKLRNVGLKKLLIIFLK